MTNTRSGKKVVSAPAKLLLACCTFVLFQIIYVATMPLQRMDNAGEEGFVGLDIVAGVAYSLYTSSFLVLVSLYQLYWLQILELSLLKKTMKAAQGTPENSPKNSPGVPSRQVAPAPEQSSQQGQSPSSNSSRRGSTFGGRSRRGSSEGGGGDTSLAMNLSKMSSKIVNTSMLVIVLSTAVVIWVYVDAILETVQNKQQEKFMLAHWIMAMLSFSSTSASFFFGYKRVMKLKKPLVLVIFVVNTILAGVFLPVTILLCDGLGLQAESQLWQSLFVIFRCLILMLQGPNSCNEVYKLLRRNIKRANERTSRAGDSSYSGRGSTGKSSKGSSKGGGSVGSATSQVSQTSQAEQNAKIETV
ncbi:hypothetical protein TrST_g7947 [Triparma strigata]|uniref:Uncharacterized protein n=1 Tax=Triparma strigata TaxID=1606541 RepID=A0A9W7EXY4_9STRA|nr:hypothetical protein TrST_g7947 [Triparma strigata]